jgi:small-conductance mechanosensitive channel
MITRRRPLIVAIVALAILDFVGIIAMISSPELTARLIPALVAIQILGFIVIAAICLRHVPGDDGANREMKPASPSRDWRIWFICGLAMLFLFRALLAVAYMASNGWRGHQVIVPWQAS